MRRRTVLMALASTHHGFFRGIARYARKHQWHLHTQMAYTNQIPYGWRGDGVISFCGYWQDLAQFVRSIDVPVVELTGVYPDLPVPRVEGNNVGIGELAADYFMERQFKHFAWAPLADDAPNRMRYDGFRLALQQHGFSVQTLSTQLTSASESDRLDWSAARERLIGELENLPKPIAVFAYNDGVGVEVIEVCQEAGLLVPEQVAVLGVDNDTHVCECVNIPLSSIKYNLEELAYQGAALLDRLMQGEAPPQETILIDPGAAVTRHSTDILAMENIKVAQALRTIWTQYTDPLLTVERVAESVGMTPCGLLKGFQRELQRTIHDEIMRKRMSHVTELLRETKLSVAVIADRTGFASANHLFRAFKRNYHQSPNAYRKANQVMHS